MCHFFEVGVINVVFGLLLARTKMPRLAALLGSWLVIGGMILPLALFLGSLAGLRPALALAPFGAYLSAAGFFLFLVWTPRG